MVDFKDRAKPESGSASNGEPSEELVALYQQHVPEYLAVLIVALSNGDEEEVLFQCHKISSAVKIMGFDNIAVQLDTIQAARPQGEELKNACNKVVSQINHTLLLLDK